MDKNGDGVPAEIEQAWRAGQWLAVAKVAAAQLKNRSRRLSDGRAVGSGGDAGEPMAWGSDEMTLDVEKDD
jgi:hypothetical protein